MKTSKFWFFFLLVFIFSIQNVFGLVITKTSGPKTSPWVEFYNDEEDVKNIENIQLITNYEIKSSKHTVNLVEEKSATFEIPPKSYFIIAQNPTKKIFDNLKCPVFKSSFNFIIGEVLFYDDLEYTVDSVEALDFTSCTPETENTILEELDNSLLNSDPKTDNEEEVLENNLEKYGDIQVLLPKQKTATALAVNEFIVSAIDSKKQLINSLDFNISFGDGGEIIGKQEVSHIYTYPGDYILIAEAKGFTSGAKAIMNIKVIEPDIKIEKVGEIEEENYIELKNNTNYDLYLSGFLIKVNDREYTLPKNLMLGKNRATKISGDILGFKMPSENVSLLYPNRKVLTKFEKEATSTPEIVEVLLEENTLSKEMFLIDTIGIESLTNLPLISSNNLPVNVKEENTSNIKSENTKVSNFNIIQKESQTVLKRLVLEEGKTSQKIVKSGENKTKEQNNSVDIKLITWLKNLVY